MGERMTPEQLRAQIEAADTIAKLIEDCHGHWGGMSVSQALEEIESFRNRLLGELRKAERKAA